MTEDERKSQVEGLKRRIAVLEAENKTLIATIRFVNQTIELCRNPATNALTKIADRSRAEEMIRAALKGK